MDLLSKQMQTEKDVDRGKEKTVSDSQDVWILRAGDHVRAYVYIYICIYVYVYIYICICA